jgi:hypothetical protein
MLIRPIRLEELNVFATFSGNSQRNERFLAYLTQMWDEGYISPELCFVAEEAGELIGRIVYWKLPSLNNFLEIDFLEVSSSANYFEVGAELLSRSLDILNLPIDSVIQHTLDIPYPTISPSSSIANIELLEKFGFSLVRETCRFELQAIAAEVKSSAQLLYCARKGCGRRCFY